MELEAARSAWQVQSREEWQVQTTSQFCAKRGSGYLENTGKCPSNPPDQISQGRHRHGPQLMSP